MKYPTYFESDESRTLIRKGMQKYQRGKRMGDLNLQIIGKLMIEAGGGTVKQAAPPSRFIWGILGFFGKQEAKLDRVEAAKVTLKAIFNKPQGE